MNDRIPKVILKDLVEVGAYYGHKKTRRRPKMEPYLYAEQEGMDIIDLRQTQGLMQRALGEIYTVAKNNGKILFVGTKSQAKDLIAEYAQKCGQHYVNTRWLGGILTNWHTIAKSINSLEEKENLLADEEKLTAYTKKEILQITRQKDKLLGTLGGIRNLQGTPDLLVVIDTNREDLAIKEAAKLGVKIVAIVDSNASPDNIDYIIPANDDAIKAIRLYCELMCNTVLVGIEDSLKEAGVDVKTFSAKSTPVVGYDNKSKNTKRINTPKALSGQQVKSDVSDDSLEKIMATTSSTKN
ncbi:MAG: 30S ribosomal protein S2 [Rickettsiaceae bacterium]|nr:30S ribosomal protein S2 [Rickettsiaceae bacterium]